eukprot:4336326-Heterocapsa_arctica.AAC.1
MDNSEAAPAGRSSGPFCRTRRRQPGPGGRLVGQLRLQPAPGHLLKRLNQPLESWAARHAARQLAFSQALQAGGANSCQAGTALGGVPR